MGDKKMICVIYGSERLLMNKKLEALKKEYDCSNEMMNLSIYHGDNNSMEEVYEDLITTPFLAPKKMVVFYRPLFLTGQRVKKEEDEALFLKYLKEDNEDTIFVLFNDKSDFDNRKKSVKELKKVANYFIYEPLDYYKVKEIIRTNMKDRKVTIDEDALELFMSRVSNDLTHASLEMEKLCLYSEHIDKQAVHLLISKPIEDDVFSLTKAIMLKDYQQMFSIYRDLRALKEEPVKLIVLIGNQMRLLYQVKLLDRKGYNDQEIGKMLAVNPYRLKYVRQEGKEFTIQELLKNLDALASLDEGIKTGKIDKDLGFELFMLKIKGAHDGIN